MLCRKFELVPIKIGFFKLFKNLARNGYERIFHFFIFFGTCTDVHVLMLNFSNAMHHHSAAHGVCCLAHLVCFVGNPEFSIVINLITLFCYFN